MVTTRRPGLEAVRRMRMLRRLVVVWTAMLVALTGAAVLDGGPPAGAAEGGDADRPHVVVAPIEGAIDPVTKDFVELAVRRASADDADALVLMMDTPGGLSTSMNSIIRTILNEKQLPVIVYVAPKGSRAASAGAFITMASDAAGMASSTSIGSATPIQGGGEDIKGDLRKKVLNDAVSQIRGLARESGRNADVAESMVRDAANFDEEEALEKNIVEFVADDLDELLEKADGFRTKAKDITLDTAGARVTELSVPWHMRLLKLVIDPNILFLLFTAGLLGLGFEITHPGTIFPGVIGAICIVVALYGFQVLPTNVAGIVLILLGVMLMVAEAFVPSSGVLGVGGVVALVLGGLLLFDREQGLSVSLPLIIVVALLLAAFFGVVVHKVMQVRHEKPRTSQEEIIGEVGTVRRPLDPQGSIFVMGEIWQARAPTDDLIDVGTDVVVESIDGLELGVRRAAAIGQADGEPPTETPNKENQT